MSIWREFFEDSDGRGSTTRLLQLASFPFSTGIACYIHTVEALGTYGGLYVLGYIAGKGADAWAQRKPQPAVKAEGPTTINVKGKKS